MENEASWHGTPPKKEQFEKALPELLTPDFPRARVEALLKRAADQRRAKLRARRKTASPNSCANIGGTPASTMKVEMDPTRMGFGRGLERAGEDPRVVTLHADISGSIRITDFESKHPERNNRVFSVGIAEQNMMSVAAGLAREGFIPVTGTYGVFASGRAWDQIRTTICYSNLNVKIAGAHGGISVGPDGATHQALEEIALTSILPNMHVVVPCDSVETQKATEYSLLELQGPVLPALCARSHPHRDQAGYALRIRRRQRHSLPRRTAQIPRCVRDFPRAALQERKRASGHHRLRPHGSGSDARRLAPERGVRHRNAHRERSYRETAGYRHLGARRGRNARRGHRGRTSGWRLREYRGRQPFCSTGRISGSHCSSAWWASPIASEFPAIRGSWCSIFGLTAEHIAKRVLDLMDNRVVVARESAPSVNAIHCAQCNAVIPLSEAAKDLPMPSGEVCADCDYRSTELCAACRVEWSHISHSSAYVCHNCR